MARKIQLPTIGGLRKVIKTSDDRSANPGTTIREFANQIITLAQLKAALGLTTAITNPPPGGNNTGSLIVGPGLGGGGPLVGAVPLYITAPIPWMMGEDGGGGDGDPGPPGSIGVNGASGTNGPATFLTAEDGQDGADGIPGGQGPQGNPGSSGINGAAIFMSSDPGEDGLDGVPGPRGLSGASGASGANGPAVFLSGDDGADGLDAIPGPRGLDGASGTNGANGPAIFMISDDGADGEPGPPGATGSGGSGAAGIWVTPLDNTPASPNAMDDEFNDNSFNTSMWTWINQGSTTVTETSATIAHAVFTTPSGAGDAYHMVYQPIPGGTWKFRTKMFPTFALANYVQAGLALYRSANSHSYQFGPLYAGSQGIYIQASNIETGGFAGTSYSAAWLFDRYTYLEIEYDGTNYIFRYAGAPTSAGWNPFMSSGSPTFTTAFTVAPATFLAGAADRIALTIASWNGSNASATYDWFRRIS